MGFPKFKSAKHSRKSYTTNNQKGSVALKEGHIRLPKIGMVKTVIHRKPDINRKLRSVTVSQDSDGRYYASVIFENDEETQAITASPERAVGLDYKSDGLYMDSNGYSPEGHKYYRQSQKKLTKAQRKLRNRTVGSSTYTKTDDVPVTDDTVAPDNTPAPNDKSDDLPETGYDVSNTDEAANGKESEKKTTNAVPIVVVASSVVVTGLLVTVWGLKRRRRFK